MKTCIIHTNLMSLILEIKDHYEFSKPYRESYYLGYHLLDKSEIHMILFDDFNMSYTKIPILNIFILKLITTTKVDGFTLMNKLLYFMKNNKDFNKILKLKAFL